MQYLCPFCKQITIYKANPYYLHICESCGEAMFLKDLIEVGQKEEKAFVYCLYDINGEVIIGIYDKYQTLKKDIENYPENERISENFSPSEELFEIWEVEQNAITLEYDVMAEIKRIKDVESGIWETEIKEIVNEKYKKNVR